MGKFIISTPKKMFCVKLYTNSYSFCGCLCKGNLPGVSSVMSDDVEGGGG